MNINKKKLLIIGFIVIFVASFVFLFLQKKSIVDSSGELPMVKNDIETKKDLAVVENKYQQDAKKIFNDYTAKESNNSLDATVMKQLKNDFLALKVTEKYKNVHLQIVLSMLKTEKFLTNNSVTDKEEGEKIISEVRTQNPWLN